jgi:hypothetical protein
LVEKMLLFNREVKYQIHSGSGLAGSGSEMIYSVSGSGKKFRIRIHNTGKFVNFLNKTVFCVLSLLPVGNGGPVRSLQKISQGRVPGLQGRKHNIKISPNIIKDRTNL